MTKCETMLGIYRETKLLLLLSTPEIPHRHTKHIIHRAYTKYSRYAAEDYIDPRGYRVKCYGIPDYQTAVIFVFMSASSKQIQRIFERGVNLVNQYRGNPTLDFLVKMESLVGGGRDWRYLGKYEFDGGQRDSKSREKEGDGNDELGLVMGNDMKEDAVRSPFGFLLTEKLPDFGKNNMVILIFSSFDLFLSKLYFD